MLESHCRLSLLCPTSSLLQLMHKCAALNAQNRVHHSRALSELQHHEHHVPAEAMSLLLSHKEANVQWTLEHNQSCSAPPPRKPRR